MTALPPADDFAAFVTDWSALDALAAGEHPARRFMRAAWFASGTDAAETVVPIRSGDGELLAAMPLSKKAFGPVGISQIAGPYWPFRGFPVRATADANELRKAFSSKSLGRELGPVWRLGPAVDDDPSLEATVRAATAAGWTVLSRPVGSLFVLDLKALRSGGNWPSSKGKQKDRWRVRQLGKTGPVTIRAFDGRNWTEEDREAIARIESNSWVGQLEEGGDTKFADPALRKTWTQMSRDPVLAGMIRGHILHVGDTPAAFTFCLETGDTRYCIANNFDQRFKNFSPGRVLLYYDFEDAADRGIARIDWGLGDGGYKSQMGATQGSSVSDLLFVRSRLLAPILKRIWQRG
ncbi:GNAT family N-acetyltransferase [Qipengyuania sp. JC766]|uniref:GNAT family N-acetyltransferase n=1 Tax=Qipengyuania sp. JC766 TaxID=3232139 RepID=UPI003458296A